MYICTYMCMRASCICICLLCYTLTHTHTREQELESEREIVCMCVGAFVFLHVRDSVAGSVGVIVCGPTQAFCVLTCRSERESDSNNQQITNALTQLLA